jgi:hypothetical protein
VRKLAILFALGVFGAGLLATTGSAAGAGVCGAQAPREGTGHFGGVISAQAIASSGSCAVHNTGDPAQGTPPLLYWGGPVMANAKPTPMTVTPIFWNPGHTMDGRYKDLLRQYLSDVAAASGANTNVFSVATEYFGSNGTIGNYIRMGAPIDDHQPLPASGCLVATNDGTGIYADGTGYNACLDDSQITGEIQRLIDASHGHLAQNDYSHIYVIYTPKHVESCFYPGDTTSTAGGQACTINNQPTAAYCAYHGMMGNNWPDFGTIYANMPFPIYASPVGYTCGSDAGNFLGGLQSPNHNLDADTELSPTSHEINEAITDPNVYNGWYDNNGYENGDECAYVWGATAGNSGQKYNQVIKNHKYLTQEEFSNTDFFDTGGGCVQSKSAVG